MNPRLPSPPACGFWRTVARFACLGPLLGGLPYNVLVLSIPFSYALGLLPASLCGVGFALWWHAPQRRAPGWAWRAGMGALFGLLACAAAALLVDLSYGRLFGYDVLLLAGLLALHGVPAGLLLGLIQPPRTAALQPGLPRLPRLATCP